MQDTMKAHRGARLRVCALALLSFVAAGTQQAHAGVVDDMITSGVPHTEWYEFDAQLIGVNLVRNPGEWSQPVHDGNLTITVWEGADSFGQGADIPPYSKANYWYQRQIDCVSPGSIGCSSRTSLYPNLDPNGSSSSLLAIAADVPMPGQGLRLSAYAARTNQNSWIYRYSFSNISSTSRSFEFQLSEFDNHEGFHHEFSFLDAKGQHAYDQLPFSAVIDEHNYHWSSLTLDPGASLVVGFSDVDAPAMETWGIRSVEGVYVESLLKLPVPAVPEPSSAALLLGLLSVLRVWLRRPWFGRR